MRLCRRFGFIGLGHPEIPGQTGWVAQMPALSDAGLFAIRNVARGQTACAREQLKTVRPGAAIRERFSEGGGEKRFGVTAGEPILTGHDENSSKMLACMALRSVFSSECSEKTYVI